MAENLFRSGFGSGQKLSGSATLHFGDSIRRIWPSDLFLEHWAEAVLRSQGRKKSDV
jgi:hypothetical protein